jgi:citronellol/citronellal dehydrogenase
MIRLARHSTALAKRNLIGVYRNPEALLDVTLQPIIFILLFTYVFGGAISGGSQHDYLQFLLPGILAQTIAFGGVAIGVNLNSDIEKGVFDRFRSLPIARAAPLVGAVLADCVRYAIAGSIALVLGLILNSALLLAFDLFADRAREPDEVERVVAAALERFGAIDVLVNNAGGQFTAPAEEISDKGWRAVHRLSVDAVWSITRTVATRSMIPRRDGLVVFIGFSPRRGIPGYAHAAAARAAMGNLATGLALEWSRYGIRSVSVLPGMIDTEGLAGYGADNVEAWTRAIPLGRLGRPEEVGSLIAFLASPGGAYVTATSVLVDGGVDAWGQGELPPPPERAQP